MWLLYAGLAAVCFGLRGVLYHWTSQKPIDRNLLLFGVFLSGAVVALSANLVVRQEWTLGAFTGMLMGLFSFTSNAAMYKGFAVGKASLIAILTGMPPVAVVAGAYLLWGETLNSGQFWAFVVILCGIILLRYSGDFSLKNLKGVQWGVLAMFAFAITDLSSKQSTLWGGQTLPTLFMMYSTGALLFFIFWRQSLPAGRAKPASPTPGSEGGAPPRWPISKTLIWGAVVGTTNISGMMLILPAFRLGITGLVTAIIAMNTLIILMYARVFLKETLSRMELTGMLCTLAGVVILRVLG